MAGGGAAVARIPVEAATVASAEAAAVPPGSGGGIGITGRVFCS